MMLAVQGFFKALFNGFDGLDDSEKQVEKSLEK
jgi:hypothetical protein